MESMKPAFYRTNNIVQLTFATEICYIIAFISVKISFLLFYLEIFRIQRTMRKICHVMIVFLICQCVEEMLVVIFQCSPVHKAWLPYLPGKCLNLYPFYWASFGIKLTTDLIIFFLPIPPLLRIRLPPGKKYGIIIMFLLGLM